MKKYSLCCISMKLQSRGIKSSTMTRKSFLSMDRAAAINTVSKRTLNNIKVVKETLNYCADKKWNYRIGGGIMPLQTLPEANLSYDVLPDKDEIKNEYSACKDIIATNKIRCSTHPDQYTVIASIHNNVVENSIIDLNCHADMMDLFGLSQSYDSPINIHMNSYKGENLKVIADRFISVYKRLNVNVKSRLVLECEDKPNSWNTKQLYTYIYQEVGIPITYDSLHHRNNTGGLTEQEAYNLARSTWGSYTPLFHFSDTDTSLDNPRAHADYPTELHSEFVNDDELHLECEFKMKDHAIDYLENKINNPIDKSL